LKSVRLLYSIEGRESWMQDPKSILKKM